jgi:uncharacterized repeat protein (TIGR04076 family)
MNERFKEDWKFIVTVTGAKEGCRAGHKVGDTFQFEYGTPLGLCGEAFHGMYPVIHAMRLGADLAQYSGAKDHNVSQFTCPDEAWITFEIRRVPLQGGGS